MSGRRLRLGLAALLGSAGAAFLGVPAEPCWEVSGVLLAATLLCTTGREEFRRPVGKLGILIILMFPAIVFGTIAVGILWPDLARIAYSKPAQSIGLRLAVGVAWLSLLLGLWRRMCQGGSGA